MNSGVAFPSTASPQTFPLNGAQNTVTKQQTFPLAFQELRPRVYEFRPLVGFEFDSGTRRYGYEGHAGETDFYSPKALSIGEIYKEVPQLWGLYSIGNCTITLDNNDKEFSILKATEPFHGRVGWVALCEPYYGEQSIQRLFTGQIDSWSMQGGKMSVTLRDATSDRFLNTINQYATVLNTTDFPDLPEYQRPKLIPIAFGNQTRATAAVGGDDVAINVLPAYLIDPAIGFAGYKYIGLQHVTLATDINVFVNSILQTSGYTIGVGHIAGYPWPGSGLYITFDADPRTFGTHSPDDVEVTFSTANSLVNDADVPGYGPFEGNIYLAAAAVVTQPVIELYVLFYMWSIMDVSTELDLDSWFSAYTAMLTFLSATPSTELAVVKEDMDIKTILARWAETFLGWFYMTKAGKLALTVAAETPTWTMAVSDSDNIIKDSFRIDSNRQVASRLQYNYAYNHVGDYFEKQPDLHDAGEETNLGQDIRDNRDLWYLRSDASGQPLAVATLAMESMTENTQLVSFSLPIRYHAGIDVTKTVTLTHFEGIDASGLGYDAVTVRILSVRFNPHPSSSSIAVTGIVVP